MASRMIQLFDDISCADKKTIYINLVNTYLNSTGIITFNSNTFYNKFKDTILIGNIKIGGFILKKRTIAGKEYFKLIAIYSKWYKYINEYKVFIEKINVYVFLTNKLIPVFQKIGFNIISDVSIVNLFLEHDMTYNNYVEQHINGKIFKKKLLLNRPADLFSWKPPPHNQP